MSALSAPAAFSATGALMLEDQGTADHQAGGKQFTTASRIVTTQTQPTVISWVHGLPFDGSGRLFVTSYNVATGPLYRANGILLDADGAVVCVDEANAVGPIEMAQGLRFDANGAIVVDGGLFFSLNFLSGTLDPRLTFTRASNATMFDSQGRLIWAPANMVKYSEDISNAGGWTPLDANTSATIVTDSALLAAGAGTDQCTEVTGIGVTNGYYGNAGNRPMTPGAPYTLTAWVKRVSGANTSFTFNAGTASASFPLADTDWHKVSQTLTVTGAAGTPAFYKTLAGVWRIANVQVEPAGLDSPKPYVATAASAYYGPRFDYSPTTLSALGVQIEESRTNGIPNSAGVGAVIGTPGTLPTGWGYAVSVPTTSIEGTGVEDGMPYVDIRLQGTSTGTISEIRFCLATAIPAVTGQSWALSGAVRMVAGSMANISGALHQLVARDAGGAFLGVPFNYSVTKLNESSICRAIEGTSGAVSFVGTAFVQPDLVVVHSAGAAIDITFRIGLMQAELLGTGTQYPTSLIPTYGTAATRAEDNLSIPTAGWVVADTGAMFAQFSQPYVDSSATAHGVAVMDGNARWIYTIQGAVRAYDGTTVRPGPAYTANTQMKAILALVAGTMRQSVNGSAVASSAYDGTFGPSGTLKIGDVLSGVSKLNGWVARVTYYPTALTDVQLQALTA